MRENISVQVKETLEEFRKLNSADRLYVTSIILNRIKYGLINDGNYLDSDDAYNDDKLVLEPQFIGLDNDTNLATQLLLVASQMNEISIDPNGIDIEPYVKNLKDLEFILSKFYKLNYCDKLDFISEIIYDISNIDNVQSIDFDFNGLINEIVNYRQDNFGSTDSASLEIN